MLPIAGRPRRARTQRGTRPSRRAFDNVRGHDYAAHRELYLSAALDFRVDEPEELADASQLLAYDWPFKPADWDKLTPEMLRNVERALIVVSGPPLIAALKSVTLPGVVVERVPKLDVSMKPFTKT
jgi:hypothetical protein